MNCSFCKRYLPTGVCDCHENISGILSVEKRQQLEAAGWRTGSADDFLAPERAAFEAFVEEWTGRDMRYHKNAETWGLEFAWACWQRAKGLK